MTRNRGTKGRGERWRTDLSYLRHNILAVVVNALEAVEIFVLFQDLTT